MSESALVLHVDRQFASPYAMSVFVTLAEKGIPFEIETVDLGTQQNLQPPYRDISLTALVPSLMHNNLFLSESSAMIEYLDEVFGLPTHASVYPNAIEDRARVRQIQAWLRSDLLALRSERITAVIFFAPTTAPLSEEGRRAADKLLHVADRLLAEGAVHLFGKWCIADTELALMLNRLMFNGDSVPDKLRAYAAAQWQRPSVQQWVEYRRTRPA
jgi:glutathione S-transferase